MGNFGQPGGGIDLISDGERECPFCHGRGEIAAASICPVCNGRKNIYVKAPAVTCAFCGGQGQMPPRSNLTCWVCKGRGIVSVTPPVETCPDCQGRGKRPCESLYCPRCRGVGVVALVGSAEAAEELGALSDVMVCGGPGSTPRIQEAHGFALHAVCELVSTLSTA